MKGLVILTMALLVGCAEVRTLEELELAAMQSGDWSAVERRERAVARRAQRGSTLCPSGSIPVCDQRPGETRCHCTSQEDLRAIFERL